MPKIDTPRKVELLITISSFILTTMFGGTSLYFGIVTQVNRISDKIDSHIEAQKTDNITNRVVSLEKLVSVIANQIKLKTNDYNS